MFNLSKGHLNPNQQQNLTSFKQQTLQLIKQQSQKMKQLNAYLSSKQEELLIKNQQINFLKETVKELERENQLLIHQKNQQKIKLDKIVEEVKLYNQNVVKPICLQKEELRKENLKIKQQKEQTQKNIIKIQNQNAELQALAKTFENQLLNSQQSFKKYQMKCAQLQQKLQKQSLVLQKHASEILRTNKLLNQEFSAKEKLSIEVSTLSKQLNSVVNKYNSSIKDYEQKIKELQSNRIDIAEVKVYEQLIKSKELQINNLKAETVESARSHQELKVKYLSEKQKLTKEVTASKLKLSQISTDLLNLRKSIQLERKVVEFESQNSELFYSLYEKYEKSTQQRQQLREKCLQLTENCEDFKRQVQKLAQSLKDTEIQQLLMKTHLQQQLQRLESTYEGKLVSLNLKIRKQEEALERLNKRQIQSLEQKEKLSQQLESVTQQFASYKQTIEKSTAKLNEENYKIVQQIQELYKICEENVDSKRVVDKMKHVVHALLTVLYYNDLKILRHRDKQRKIYLPILKSYLQIKLKLQEIESLYFSNAKDQKSKKQSQNLAPENKSNFKNSKQTSASLLRKLRSTVWTVIAMLRLQKEVQNKPRQLNSQRPTGIKHRFLKSLSTRNKIPNMNELLQKQAEVYQQSEEVQQIVIELLKMTGKVFSWPEQGLKKLNTNLYLNLNILERIQSCLTDKIEQNC